MTVRDVFRRAAHVAEPRALSTVRQASGYARSHGLSGSLKQRLTAHRRAAEVGLQLLPSGLTLDGLVVDVGANHGTFTDTIRRLEPRSRVLAVEPEPKNVEHLRGRFADDAAVTVVDRAASDRAGVSVLNVTQGTEFASLHAPLSTLEDEYGDASRVVGTAEVQTSTLDQIVGDQPVRLLKVDVQGHEIALLEGAKETLARTEALLIEVLFVSHYENDATFAQVDAAVREQGFDLVGLAPWGPTDGPLLWADACYRPRRDAAPVGRRRSR